MKPTKLSANERRLAKLLSKWSGSDAAATLPLAMYLAGHGVLAVSKATVSDDYSGDSYIIRGEEMRWLLRRLARGTR